MFPQSHLQFQQIRFSELLFALLMTSNRPNRLPVRSMKLPILHRLLATGKAQLEHHGHQFEGVMVEGVIEIIQFLHAKFVLARMNAFHALDQFFHCKTSINFQLIGVPNCDRIDLSSWETSGG